MSITYSGLEHSGASGPKRWLVYRIGLEVGLRASDIHSLTKASFDLITKPATVTVLAGYSKRRRKDVLPLRPDLADAMAVHLPSKHPQARAFNMPKSDKTAKMLRTDLAAARSAWLQDASTPAEQARREALTFLAYRDEAGLVADFHALRHTFITNLANSGVHPKVAQILARHSTIALTMDRYTHTVWEQLSDALERLPDLSEPSQQGMLATGTSGRIDVPEHLAFCLAPKGTDASNSMQSGAVEVEDDE